VQKLAEICIRRPVFATMIVLSLVVVGSASYFKLGVDRFPSVDLPTVSVRTNLPGASAEEVESLVTNRSRKSSTRSMASMNCAQFLDRHVIHYCHLQTGSQFGVSGPGRARSRQQSRSQPARRRHSPIVQKFDNDSTPVVTIALSGDRSIRELTEFADKTETRPAGTGRRRR